MRRKGVRILAIFILICINISIFSRVNADTINVVLESEEYAISQKSLTISRIIPKTDIEEFKQLHPNVTVNVTKNFTSRRLF